ncbi:hypothetical protein BDN72DRAFT_625103 [Pluteus cervinus]|uniref:Uncharacterized protein n=1 Tax=Pluteus cervinus TaxID=181527 RepID=A0ACD3A0Q4_9AGAR|nr:hypothetical protein BDN72DRAFT_625103 [Pluteus cervinus]
MRTGCFRSKLEFEGVERVGPGSGCWVRIFVSFSSYSTSIPSGSSYRTYFFRSLSLPSRPLLEARSHSRSNLPTPSTTSRRRSKRVQIFVKILTGKTITLVCSFVCGSYRFISLPFIIQSFSDFVGQTVVLV